MKDLKARLHKIINSSKEEHDKTPTNSLPVRTNPIIVSRVIKGGSVAESLFLVDKPVNSYVDFFKKLPERLGYFVLMISVENIPQSAIITIDSWGMVNLSHVLQRFILCYILHQLKVNEDALSELMRIIEYSILDPYCENQYRNEEIFLSTILEMLTDHNIIGREKIIEILKLSFAGPYSSELICQAFQIFSNTFLNSEHEYYLGDVRRINFDLLMQECLEKIAIYKITHDELLPKNFQLHYN